MSTCSIVLNASHASHKKRLYSIRHGYDLWFMNIGIHAYNSGGMGGPGPKAELGRGSSMFKKLFNLYSLSIIMVKNMRLCKYLGNAIDTTSTLKQCHMRSTLVTRICKHFMSNLCIFQVSVVILPDKIIFAQPPILFDGQY